MYEQNQVEINSNGEYVINEEVMDTYTFKQNYYWLMGDNRHGSADSRYWGLFLKIMWLVQHHLCGFPKNQETGIRWDRIFSTVE